MDGSNPSYLGNCVALKLLEALARPARKDAEDIC